MSTGQTDFLSVPQDNPQPQPVTIKPKRGFEVISQVGATLLGPQLDVTTFTADAVVEEEHEDNLVITKHPVEQGAVIADHAYKLPASVRLTYGWSAGSNQADGDPQFIQNLYQKILQLQLDRNPFDIYTGKRHYENMLLVSLRTESNAKTENALMLYMLCEEILYATTSVVVLPDPSVQANPQSTSSPVEQGQKQLVPAPNFNYAASH